MRRNMQRMALLGGLIVFAVLWTVLMGLGVTGASPSRAASGSSAAALGAGAHIMYVDESRFPTITAYLAVNDAQGQVIAELQKENFTLREDGVVVDIADFVGAGSGSSSTMLVIDQSGSMADENKLGGAIRAAQTYVNLLKPGADRLGVITFSDSSVTLAALDEVTEESRKAVNDLLGYLTPMGGTEFYAATRNAIQDIKQVNGRKVALALTDGMDTGWGDGLTQAVADAQDAKVPVYVVGLGSDVDRRGLERLARETGGQVYFSPGAAELEALYGSIASGLRNEYALTYQSLTPSLDGTQRALDVAIAAGEEDLQTGGAYTVAGVLASGLNLAVFAPTLVILFALLAALYVAPSLRRADRQSDKRTDKPTSAKKEKEPNNKPQSPPPPAGKGVAPGAQRLSPDVSTGGTSSVATADQPPPVCLVVAYRLGTADTLVGSAAGSTILLPSAAPQQARIHLSAGRYAVDHMAGDATQVSYSGDPAQLRTIQRNALRDGSLVQFGALRFVFRQNAEGASLERRTPVAPRGLIIGTDFACDVVIAAPSPQRTHLRAEGQHWLVERLAGECQVSYSGGPDQLRAVVDRNALKPGSLLTVGGVLLRLEPA